MAGVTRLPTPLSEDKPTLARQLKKAGYATAVFGKMHFNQPAKPGLHGFDVVHDRTGDHARVESRDQAAAGARRACATKPQWHPFKDPARIWLNADKLPYPRYESDMRSLYQFRSGRAVPGSAPDAAVRDVGEFHGAALALRFSDRRSRPLRSRRVSRAPRVGPGGCAARFR